MYILIYYVQLLYVCISESIYTSSQKMMITPISWGDERTWNEKVYQIHIDKYYINKI